MSTSKATPDTKLLRLMHLPSTSYEEEDHEIAAFINQNENKEFGLGYLISACSGGSVNVMCSLNTDIVTNFEINGRTFIVDKIEPIVELHNEDADGNYSTSVYNGFEDIKIDSNVMSKGVTYMRNKCSGINKKGIRCGNCVRTPESRCRWHLET